MYDRILVPLDGSTPALDALGPACRLARLHRAGLWLVTVRRSGTDPLPANVFAAAREALPAGPVTVAEETALDGEPGPTLAAMDRDNPRALVCLTSHGRHPLSRALLGSVAHDVVRRSDQAVVVVGPGASRSPEPDLGRILVCVDGSDHGEAVLPWAAAWQLATGIGLRLVRVHYPHTPPEARVPPGGEHLEDLGYLSGIATEVRRRGGDAETLSLVHTDPGAALLDQLADLPGTLVALATRSLGPVRDLVVGSTFTALLRKSTAPLLVASRAPTPDPFEHPHA